MKTIVNAALALGLALSLGAATAPSAFAKAHDQGVADGMDTPTNDTGSARSGTGNVAGQKGGISGGQNDGQRGGIASSRGGGNRTEPVDRPGRN